MIKAHNKNRIKAGQTVFMMDLLATVPYYTAYLSSALLAEGVPVMVGSIDYYLDRGCFSTRQIDVDPGLLNLVGKLSLPRWLRRPLKLLETIVNMAALAVRFTIGPPAIIHVQYLPMLLRKLPIDAWFVSFCALLGSKSVLTVHDLLAPGAPEKHCRIFRALYSRMDAIICHSDHVKLRLAREFGVALEKIWTIPHGPFFYDLPQESSDQIRRVLQASPGQLIVLWQGIIFPYKGLDILLDAWRAVESASDNVRLVVVGTGAPHLLDQIRAQVKRLGIERVTLLFRFASTAELVSIYQAADIVVYPYREITTSGALATGLALGKAIVASDLPVFRELLTSGIDALLVEPNDASSLAAGIMKLLQDQELREAIVTAVGTRDFGPRSWRVIASQTQQIYDAVLTFD
jgi:glycosyltransferase involved in cell wall biosynthesis